MSVTNATSVTIRCVDGVLKMSNTKFGKFARFSSVMTDLMKTYHDTGMCIDEFDMSHSGCTIEQLMFVIRLCKVHWDDNRVIFTETEIDYMNVLFRKNYVHNDSRDDDFIFEYFGKEGITEEHMPFIIAVLNVATFFQIQCVTRVLGCAVALLIREKTRLLPVSVDGCARACDTVANIFHLTPDERKLSQDNRAACDNVIEWYVENHGGHILSTSGYDEQFPNRYYHADRFDSIISNLKATQT